MSEGKKYKLIRKEGEKIVYCQVGQSTGIKFTIKENLCITARESTDQEVIYMKKKQNKKTNVKRGTGVTMAIIMVLSMVLSLAGKSSMAYVEAKEMKVGGVTVNATLTDGRSSGKTTAKLQVTNGPTIGLTAQSTIYYRFGKNGYFTKSAKKSTTSVELSVSVEKLKAGAEVDQCRGYYSITYLLATASDNISVGTLKSGWTYEELKA